MIVDPDKNLLSINCAKDSKICEDNDVRSFPAIRLYRSGGEMRDPYRGPRRASEYVSPIIPRQHGSYKSADGVSESPRL